MHKENKKRSIIIIKRKDDWADQSGHFMPVANGIGSTREWDHRQCQPLTRHNIRLNMIVKSKSRRSFFWKICVTNIRTRINLAFFRYFKRSSRSLGQINFKAIVYLQHRILRNWFYYLTENLLPLQNLFNILVHSSNYQISK